MTMSTGNHRASQLPVILASVRSGATGHLEVTRRTGLPPDVVEAGLATLVAAGLVRTLPVLGNACASGGCSRCPITASCGPAPPRS